MKKKTLLSLAMLLPLLLAACSPAVVSSAGPGTENLRTISVNGSGKIILSPDMATISIGVQTENAAAQAALAENTSQVEKVMQTFSEFGIPEEDIKTTNFSIYSRQDRTSDGEIRGVYYVVNNTVLITVRDLDILGQVLDAAVRSGANNISGISFDIADRESAYTQALEAAMQNAQARAQVLANSADVSLDKVQSVNSYISAGGVVKMERAVFAEAMDSAAVPVSPGTMEITVEVSVVYTIK